jgi:hypothetical protein
MTVDEKLAYALRHVESIATHDDESTYKVEAALKALSRAIAAQKREIRVRKGETRMAKLKKLCASAIDFVK